MSGSAGTIPLSGARDRRAGRLPGLPWRRPNGACIFLLALWVTTASWGAQVPFSSQQVVDALASGAQAVAVADLDGDGDLDALSASQDNGTVGWYENADGAGTFGALQEISSAADGAQSVAAADLDGDGDLDVLSASADDDTIAWYQNLGADDPFCAAPTTACFRARQPISTTALGAQSVRPADVDGDGDVDVVSASADDGTIAWYENEGPDTGAASPPSCSVATPACFGPRQILETTADLAEVVVTADLDSDGDLDVLSASPGDDTIAWYENTDGDGSFASAQVIKATAFMVQTLFAADVDGDGDLDLVTAYGGSVDPSSNRISWFENLGPDDGRGGGPCSGTPTSACFAAEHIIATESQQAYSVFVTDVDSDGDVDVVASSPGDDTVSWYENEGPDTGIADPPSCSFATPACFGARRVISTAADFARSALTADVDGDGDLDILLASQDNDTIAWYENETIHRSAHFPERSVVGDVSTFSTLLAISAADVDGDGDVDLLHSSGSNDLELAWSPNMDGEGTFGSPISIHQVGFGGFSVFAADVDGDGDQDVLLTEDFRVPNQVSWFENIDGAGSFGPQRVITTAADGAVSVFAADVDGDGDFDALSASFADNTIAWYENTDGGGTFGPQRVITTAADSAVWVFAADLDGEGDIDVLSASRNDHKIAWYENTNGAGSFGPQRVITTDARDPRSVVAADVDGDGDLDLLSASVGDHKIAWYENEDGVGSFGPQQVITTAARQAIRVSAADLDGDGDVDALSASAGDDKIAWYENTDGAGSFGPQRLITTAADGARSVLAEHVDGDGDLDVLSYSIGGREIAWYPNRGGQFALATADVAPSVVVNRQVEEILAIEVIHRGRTSDSPLEPASLELRISDGSGVALTEAQALGLFQTLRVYRDDGSGAFDGGDPEVLATSDFSSIAGNGDGVLTLVLPAGDPDLEVSFGSPGLFFVAVEMTADAAAQHPSAFAFEHLTESSSSAEDAVAGIPLTLELVEDFQGGAVDVSSSTAGCQAPFDLVLEDLTVSTTVACEAGTVLTAGSGVAVLATGDMTVRAGQRIVLSDGFSVQAGGRFRAEIDPDLVP